MPLKASLRINPATLLANDVSGEHCTNRFFRCQVVEIGAHKDCKLERISNWSGVLLVDIVILCDVSMSFTVSRRDFMAKAYSMDFRERVLKDCDTGMRSEDVAQKCSVSASWVYDLRKKRRETGSIASKQQRHGSKPKLIPQSKSLLPWR